MTLPASAAPGSVQSASASPSTSRDGQPYRASDENLARKAASVGSGGRTGNSSLLSPVMTPLMMKLLAGQYIQIDFFEMMLTIIQIIIIPIAAGLVTNLVLQKLKLAGAWMDTCLSVVAMFSICFIIAIITSLSRNELLQVGLALIAACVLHNLIGYIMGLSLIHI